MDEFLIPLENKQEKQEKQELFKNAEQSGTDLQTQNEALQNKLLKEQSPFNNAYEQYLMKKYYGEDGLLLKQKQDINFKSRSVNEPIKQLARINKALKASDEALKNVGESGVIYGANKKLNDFTGGLIGMSEQNAELDNALANFSNMAGQVTSRGGNNSNKAAEEQRRLLGKDFASDEERVSRIMQTRKNILDYFEQEKAGLEALGYKMDEKNSLMQEYLKQKKKQEYLNKNGGGAFEYSEYEKSAYEKFVESKNDDLKRLKKQ